MANNSFNALIHDCVEFLEIKRPYKVILQTSLKNPDWFAYHTYVMNGSGKILRHIIKLTMENFSDYDLLAITAHEFVHAWEIENNIKGKMHGKKFQNKAAELQEFLEFNEYRIGKIYRPGIDTE